jgi:hypothetical protein
MDVTDGPLPIIEACPKLHHNRCRVVSAARDGRETSKPALCPDWHSRVRVWTRLPIDADPLGQLIELAADLAV